MQGLPIRWALASTMGHGPKGPSYGQPLHMEAFHDLNVSMSFCTANWGQIVMHAIRNGYVKMP